MARMFRVMGCEHSSEVTYASWDKDHEYPRRELMYDTTKHDFEIEAESMDEASLWLITYHPELYMGHSVVALDDSGDFKCTCVPSGLYSEYNTTDDEYILRMEMARLVRNVHFHEPVKIVYDDDDYCDPADWNDDYLGDHEFQYNGDDLDEGEYFDDGCPIENNNDYDPITGELIDYYYDLVDSKVEFDVCGEPIVI